MINLILFIINLPEITSEPYQVKLQDDLPIYMNCKDIKETSNGFYGKQYFFSELSNSGMYINLDKITFYLWFRVHSKMILKGNQILFSFIDGYGPDSFLNLMVYYRKDNITQQYSIAVSNEKITPEKKNLSISQTNDLFLGSWNYFLLSIDQTSGNVFINMKFFSTFNQQQQQTRDVLIQQKFIYSFGHHTRITNEQLYEQFQSYKACVNIAKFYYINGWSTMDSEIYADYFLDLKFLLRPYLDSLDYDTASLNQSSASVSFSGQVGINVYKDTQIIYNFVEQLSSFTIGFWMKASSINSDFQVLSFTDDLIEQTSIGFGVDKNNNLLLYQSFSNKQIGKIQDQQWQHITAALLEISLDSSFLQTNQQKLIRVFVGSSEIYDDFILNFLSYQRLVIGPIQSDNKGNEVVDIQDIKIFNGFGIVTSNSDCLLFVGEYCLFCKAGTHYCKEQDPLDDTFLYDCPAGYKNSSIGCQPILQTNCLRVNISSCVICIDGYFLFNGGCQPNFNYTYQPYSCQDQNALYCEQQNNKTITTLINESKIQYSKLCRDHISQYDNNQKICSGRIVDNCDQAQYPALCYKCSDGFYLSSLKKCNKSCTQSGQLKFRDSNTNNHQCIQQCSNRYQFSYNCTSSNNSQGRLLYGIIGEILDATFYENFNGYSQGFNDYYCSNKSCQSQDLDLQYTCLNQTFITVGKSSMCSQDGPIRSIGCDQKCKYCYGKFDDQCLGCYDNFYFTPYSTSCLKNCSDESNKFIYHNIQKMQCEYECPQNLLYQGDTCVSQCKAGYANYKQNCILITAVEFYLDVQQVMQLCPELCLTCSSYTKCLTCINDYPFYNDACQYSCYPLAIEVQNNKYTCKLDCEQDELIYDNQNFQGYSIKQCFQIICGAIQAGQSYQTFQHQSNPKSCVVLCDDGYYGDTNSFSCQKCSDTCLKCQNIQSFCTECQPSTFLINNGCFKNCGDKFSNYLTFQCETSCSSGVTINDTQEFIKACVSSCGQIFSDYKYKLNDNCIKTLPQNNVYCEGFNCYQCSNLCKQCSGQLDTNCTQCYQNYFFYNNTCVLDCGTLKYDKIHWLCVDSCPSDSIESSGLEVINGVNKNITSCYLTCLYQKYQYQNNCYNQQPEQTYCDSYAQYFSCGKCSELCLICHTAYSNSCSLCIDSAFQFNNSCYSDCPDEAPFKMIATKQCVVQCQYYSLDNQCVQNCQNAYVYEANKTCYSFSCPQGFYNSPGSKQCYLCYPGCSACQDSTNMKCESCSLNYFFWDGQCTQQCLINPYLIKDFVNGQCTDLCPIGSYLQSLSDGSLACKEECPLYYYSNVCVAECPNETYLDDNKCLNCAGPCSTCYGGQVDQCTQCDQGYYKDETTCYQICPDFKPIIDIANQNCIQNCLGYIYLSKMICFTQCPSYLYTYELNGKKECVEQCYQKSYLSNLQCYQCNSICKTCFGPDNDNCIECESPYYLYKQTCQSTCPQFYDTIENKCELACSVNLVVQNQYCKLQCDTGYLVYNQNCLINCPTYAIQQDSYCYDCNVACSTCFGLSENECTSCVDNYFLNGNLCSQYCQKFYDIELNLCKDSCDGKLEIKDQQQCVTNCPTSYILCGSYCVKIVPDGFYFDGIQCSQCNSNCLKCVSATSCSQCQTNYYLNEDQCENQCSNKYLFMNQVSKTCVTKCPPELFHMESYNKLFCVANCQFKWNGWCKEDCPPGTFSENSYCKQCPLNCEECVAFTKCNKCIDGYYNDNGYCLTTCLTGKTDRVNFKCVTECDEALYSYNQECLIQCPTNPLTYNYEMICYQTCPNQTYQDGQSCYSCDKNCSQCLGPTNKDCIVCALGYYLEDQICTDTCPQFYDQANLKCVLSCPVNLLQDKNNCVSNCSQFQYRDSCLDACPLYTYTSNYFCLDCPPNCIECNSYGCLRCQIPTYLQEGLCELVCPVLYDSTNNKCVDLCSQQTFQFLDNCFNECPENTYELNSECQLSCPKFMVPKINKCVDCPERCNQCLDDLVCIECQVKYLLYEGQCQVSCPLVMPYAHITKGYCLTKCTPDTYIKGFDCVESCDLIIFQDQCLDKCPSGYYGQEICKPCRLECKECTNYDVCTLCNDNYYLEFDQCDTQCTIIKDIEKKQCVDTCDKLLYKNICYQQCPLSTYEFKNICVINCNDGYYGSEQWQCAQCPFKCKLCLNETICSKCATGFYLYLTNCLEECPLNLFSDPIKNICQTSCPTKTYQYQNQCLFDCPDGYYNDYENFKCVQNCSVQQYLDKKTCYQCSIECDGCFGIGNNLCIKCQTNFKLDENGYCVGTQCKEGYFLQNQSCFKCLHKCLTCKNNLQCTKCRGTNRSQSDCSCYKGYYDDEFYEDCQKCPCDECTSLTNCLTCKNNLQLPLCSCDRVLNDDWCITCEVAKVNIYFSDDLNQIIVYFGYLATANLLNPFQPSSCEFWFDNSEVFGTNATCYLSWNRYSIVIQLKPYSTINVGDSLRFKQSFYRDIDQGLCDNYFIKSFIENKVYGPSALQKPYVLFTVPSFVSTCKIIEVNQILLDGTGQRLQKVLSWQLEQIDNEDAFLQMDAFLAQQKNEMKIPLGILYPNTTYKITVKYINMFQRVNYTKIQFTTLPIQAPYIYLTFNPLKVNFYLFDCHLTFKDMENPFDVELSIVDFKNQSSVFIHQLLTISSINELSLNESLLPKTQQLLFIATTALSIINERFALVSHQIDVQFLQTDRIIGDDNQINARGYDRNIQDEILSTRYLNYDWLCTNLYNLQPCKTGENQIMQFPQKRVIYIEVNNQNTTFAFYVKVSKDTRWTVRQQFIVLQSLTLDEEFVLNTNRPSNYINTNDEITIVVKNNQKFAFIMQQFGLISSQKIKGKTIKFRLADISIDVKSPIYIYLIPGNESLSFQLNNPPQSIKFEVTPSTGKSLEFFYYTIQNLGEGSKISIYYYFSNSTLTSDLLLQQSLNGIPLIVDSQQMEGSFQLPSGMNDDQLSLLCVIESDYGAKSFYNQQVNVIRQNYVFSNLVENFNNKINFSDLSSLHLMVVQTKQEQQQACLKQCSGVGTCINNNKCNCPPGYYFDDCSGNQQQQQYYLDIISTAIYHLITLKINNNENFKQFSQSLLFFSQFNQLIQNLSVRQCQTILQQYVNNTNNRLEEINQFSINLQIHNNEDYNYSEIDVRSIVNKNDLQTALDSIVFMWNKTLFSQDSNIYFLQNYMKQFASNVIDLTLITLGYEEEALYQIDTAKIYIIKTSNLTQYVNFSNYSASRFLSEASQEQINYDIVLSVFLRNFYAYDGYFPYPDQIYPLYDFSIRYSNKKENINLQNQISYKFQILNISTNLVCLTRNQTTYYWTDEFCVLDQMDQIYFCNCSLLAPTTIVNDLNYLYQGEPPFRIILPNILFLIYGIQVALVIGVAIKAKQTHPQISLVSPVENYKYGKVLGIMRRRGDFKINGSQKQSQYDQLKNSARLKSQSDEEEYKKNFNLNYFWQKHFLLRLIYKKLEYISLLFRCILILERINILLLIAEILDIYWYEKQVLLNVLILLGTIILVRGSENFIKNSIKQYFYTKRPITSFFSKLFILLLFILTLITVVYLYFKLENQTNIIFSNTIVFLCDLLLLDLLWFSLNKFLGEGKKKIIREKIHLFTSTKDIQLTQ